MRIAILSTITAALLLSGCVTPTGPVEVTRFNRVAEGAAYGNGSFTIGSIDENNSAATGISSSPYKIAVEREMQRIGYTESAAADKSDVIANISVTITDLGKSSSRGPVSVGVGGSTGGYRSGVGVGVGLDLTSLINPPKARLLTELSVRIVNRSDGVVIWEGRAQQQSSTGSPAAQPGIAASKLAEALFKDFPGTSGETIIIP